MKNKKNNKLKTLKDFRKISYFETPTSTVELISLEELKTEAVKVFKNLQSPNTIYPLILDNFPDDCKGSMAKDKWNDTIFRYGTEYGMLAMLFWLINLIEEDLMTNEEINKRENGEVGNN